MTQKITTWNVNGLRAVLKKGNLSEILDFSPDILMLQEVKSRPDQIPIEQHKLWYSYQTHWLPATRPGYSGVACFLKQAPLSVQVGLGLPYFDDEGRAVVVRYPDFTLINAYFPSGQRDHDRVKYKLEFYAALLDICDRLHEQGDNIIIGGDFNTAHEPIDLKNPKSNQNTSGFLPEERAWIDQYLRHGFVDAYRALYPQRVQYSWWTYVSGARTRNVGWRLDYFLISASLMPKVEDIIIHEDIYGSDHCPVTLILK